MMRLSQRWQRRIKKMEKNNELTIEELRRILANPFYCMVIDEDMCVPHQPLVTEELWIKSAVKGIQENGAEVFLKDLLENLKGNYVPHGEPVINQEHPAHGEPHILIEPMLFGDYRVQVWDERLDSKLDREYFMRGREAAVATAIRVKKDLFPDLKIYEMQLDSLLS